MIILIFLNYTNCFCQFINSTKIVKIHIHLLIALFFFSISASLKAQEANSNDQKTTKLFRETEPLSISMRYSNRDLLKETDDSTFLKTKLAYLIQDDQWDSLTVRLRARGNWRRNNCFLAPVKMEIQKKQSKNTLFDGNEELKLVLPCRNTDDGSDYIIKEFLAYKLYELLTPYHFKTRMLNIDYSDVKKSKDKPYQLLGFIIEDIREVAKRNGGKNLKKTVHPTQQDDYTTIQNDLFQFLIGNTDFSTTYQHNEKMMLVEGKKAIPVPYDFDMSGFVDANYAVVSQVRGEQLNITDVKERIYRGFRRDTEVFEKVRQDYLAKKDAFLAAIDATEEEFINAKNFVHIRSYLLEFYDILEDDERFKNLILDKARPMN